MPNDIYRRIKHRAMAAVSNIDFTTNNVNDIVLKVNDWVRSRYNRIYRAYNWSCSLRDYTLTLSASTSDYALRRNLEDIISIFDQTNGREIREMSIQEYNRFTAQSSGNTTAGQPDRYIHIGDKAVKNLLTQAEAIRIVSTSTSDVSPVVVRIHGEVNGVEVGTTLTCNGTSNVDGTQTYDSGCELRISVGTSDGTIQDLSGVLTVSGVTSGTVYAQIAPGERGFTYKWIKITPTTASSGTQPTLHIWFKKRLRPLVNDSDMPEIECADEIVEGVIADALWEDGQEQSAEAQESKFTQLVNELWLSTSKKNRNLNFVPENDDTENLTNRLFLN